MKNRKSFLLFSICFVLMISGTIIINGNLDKMMPENTNEVREYSIAKEDTKSNMSVWSRIAIMQMNNSYAIEESGGGQIRTTIRDMKENEEPLIQEIERYFFNGETEKRYYEMENPVDGKLIGISFFQKKETASLLYKEDKSLILYSKFFYYSDVSEELAEVISGKKEEILKECEEKVKEIELDFLKSFKGEEIWRLRDNLYAIKDTKNGITINYELSKKEITGFMLEK